VAAREAGLRAILWNLGNILPILHLEAALPLVGFAFEQPRKGWSVTVADVRRVFGPKRCLFGNLDSEALLLRNDPAEIGHAVTEQLDQSGPGAPLILSTGSPLPSNIDPSAVDAIMNALPQCS
jgi:uroporphyrinogen-III decarboxylase